MDVLQSAFDLVVLRINVLLDISDLLEGLDRPSVTHFNPIIIKFDEQLMAATETPLNDASLKVMSILLNEIHRHQKLLASFYDKVMQKNISSAAVTVEQSAFRIVFVLALLILTLVVIALLLLWQMRDKQELRETLRSLDQANDRLILEVKERRKAEDSLRHMARHDSLTGLYNRTVFVEMTNQAISRSRRHRTRCAVLFLDLDGFKLINDTHGHEVGDKTLTEISSRFVSSIREIDTVARIGGDEFTILLPDLEDTDRKVVQTISERIIDTVTDPVECGDLTLHLSVSIGVAFFPDQGADAFELIRLADIAMYEAKGKGKNRCLFSDSELRN